MATVITPAPTYAEVILFDKDGKRPRFNPIWLKWFLDLSQEVNETGSPAPSVHTAVTLTANRLVIGAGGVDVAILSSLGTTTQVLHGNAAGAPTWAAVNLGAGGDVTGTLPVASGGTGNTTGTATVNANLTGPITSVGNATSIAAQTGTGSTFVMNTSPTLVTPILGVASATSLAVPTLTTASGAMTVTPASGSNLNIVLSTTGDFAVNTNQFYVDTSTGFIGIGTAAPDNRIHVVSSSAGLSEILLQNTNSGTTGYAQFQVKPFGYNGWTIGSGGSGEAYFGVAGKFYWFDSQAQAMRMVIDTLGNVGIGNTAPLSRLSVGTKVADDNAYSYDTNSLVVVHQTPTSASVLNDPQTALMLARQGTSAQAYGAAAAFNLSRYENAGVASRTRLDISLAHASFDPTSNIVMTMLSSGNVGIGTSAPLSKLSINGGLHVGGDSDAGDNNALIDGTLGVTGVATFTAAPVFSSLTASLPVIADASKNLVSATQTGTGTTFVMSTQPTLSRNAGNSSDGLTLDNANTSGWGSAIVFSGFSGSAYSFSSIVGEAFSTGGSVIFKTANASKVLTTALSINHEQAVTIPGATTLGGNAYPTVTGINDQVLTTNGSGSLSWTDKAGGGGGGITSLEGQTGATQTFTDDTNVTIVSAANAHVITWSGTLAVARGGTGAGTLTGLLQGNGTGAVTGITNSSTVGQVLRVTGANTYAWGAVDLADVDAVTGVLPAANVGPAGSTTQVQFNDAGALAGSAGFTFNKTTFSSSIGGNYAGSTLLGVSNVNTAANSEAGMNFVADAGGFIFRATSAATATIGNLSAMSSTSTGTGVGTMGMAIYTQNSRTLGFGTVSQLTDLVIDTSHNTTVNGTLKLGGAVSGFVGLKGASAAGSITYTLPSADGSVGQFLRTDGAATLSWVTSSGSSKWTASGSDIYYDTGNVGIGVVSPFAQLTVGSSQSGTSRSSTLMTSAGALGTTAGDELALASIGYTASSNSVLLGIRANRVTNGTNWLTTAIGLGMDVDNTVRAGANIWLSANGNVSIGTTTPDSYSKLSVNGQARASNLPLTPQMYGAVADGLTDDSTAVQACITAGTTYFPPGTYLTKTIMLIPSDRLIYGAGTASIIKVDSTFVGTAMSWAGTEKYGFGNSGIATAAANANIEVHSLKFLATATTAADFHLIHFHNTSNWKVHHCDFDGAAGAGDAVAGTAVSRFQITNNHAVDFTNCCYDIWEGSSYGTLAGNFGRTSPGGAGIFVNGVTTQAVVAHTYNITVTGNTIVAGGGAANGQGIYIAGLPGGSTTKYCTCTGNTVASSGSNTFVTGIDVRDGGYNTVTGNTVIGAHSYGLFVTSDYNTITGNIAPTAVIGIHVGGSYNALSVNIVSNVSNTGVNNAINRADYLDDNVSSGAHGFGFAYDGGSASAPTGAAQWQDFIIDATHFRVQIWNL